MIIRKNYQSSKQDEKASSEKETIADKKKGTTRFGPIQIDEEPIGAYWLS